MKIATYNANSIRMRLGIVKKWLAEHQPDVLCVQETKVQNSEFPLDEFDGLGYEIAFMGQKSYNGVAIFSKAKPDSVEFGLDEEPRDEPRLVLARFGDVNIINTYIPQGADPESEKYVYKLDWYKRLREFIEKRFTPADKVIWLGDLNVAPTENDVHNPKGLLGHVCFRQETWDAYQNVLDWGFTDILRKHYPDDVIYTFWDYRGSTFVNNRGWRIDHILATDSVAECSVDCYVDKEPRGAEKPSDHTFLVAEFNL